MTTKAVDMVRGFDTITIMVAPEDGKFVVAGSRIYWTAQGGRVGGTSEKYFSTEDQARSYANKWFSNLKAKGWKRTR